MPENDQSLLTKRIASCFITASLAFFIIGCIEGLMFPSWYMVHPLYAFFLHVPPEQVKPFMNDFLTKIHTHITLVGGVCSALMGILYAVVPNIGQAQRYIPWVAYSNLVMHILGVLLMTVGFHTIGSVGLSAGFEYASPEFREATHSFRFMVIGGGILVTFSGLLFAFNILRTLFGNSRS